MHVDTDKPLAQRFHRLEISPEQFMALIFARQMDFHHYLVDIIKIVQRKSSKSYPLATLNVRFNDNMLALHAF